MRRKPAEKARPGVLLMALAIFCLSSGAGAKIFLTVEEGLELAFPSCEVERETVFLTEAQVARAADLSGAEVASALVYAYRATCGGKPSGVAYFDNHRVRTLPETLMIVVDPESRVQRIEIVAFREPEEYIPRGAWYDQLLDQPLADDLQLKRGIRPVTGATLTARASTEAVRRVLALHQVIVEAAAVDEENSAEPGR